MDSNNIKYSTDSQETIKKIRDEMEKDNSSNKNEDNRNISNKKLRKNNNTSNSNLDNVFNRLYTNTNRRINRELRTLRITKNIIDSKSQGNSFKNPNDIDIGKILEKRIRNRPSYTKKKL